MIDLIYRSIRGIPGANGERASVGEQSSKICSKAVTCLVLLTRRFKSGGGIGGAKYAIQCH